MSAVPYKSFPVDKESPWSFSAADGQALIDKGGMELFKAAHLIQMAGEDPENKGSYKLPVVKLKDGTATVYVSALRAAGNILQGSRGGVDAPAADKKAAARRIVKHWKDADLDVPEGIQKLAGGMSSAEVFHPFPLPTVAPDEAYPYKEPMPFRVQAPMPGAGRLPSARIGGLIKSLRKVTKDDADHKRLDGMMSELQDGKLLSKESLGYLSKMAKQHDVKFISRPGEDGAPVLVLGETRQDVASLQAPLPIPSGPFSTCLGHHTAGFPFPFSTPDDVRNEAVPTPVSFCEFATECPALSDDAQSFNASCAYSCPHACKVGCPIQAAELVAYADGKPRKFSPTITVMTFGDEGEDHSHMGSMRYNFRTQQLEGLTTYQAGGEFHTHRLTADVPVDQAGSFEVKYSGEHPHTALVLLDAPISECLLYLEGCPDQICADYYDAHYTDETETFVISDRVTSAVSFSSLGDAPDIEGRPTFDINDVEIFDTGKWHGDEWTEQDIQELVDNFDELRATIKPPVKIGHSNKILENDSLPAVGWIESLRRVGTKIVANLRQVPKLVKDLISHGAYKRVSSEILLNYIDRKTGQRYGKVLRAIALLGAEIPEVKTLQDVAVLYGDGVQVDTSELPVRVIDHDVNGGRMPNEDGGNTAIQQQLAEAQQRNAELSAQLEQTRLANEQMLLRTQTADAEATFSELAKDGKVNPAQKDLVTGLIKAAHRFENAAGQSKVVEFSTSSGLAGGSLVEGIKTLLRSFKENGQVDLKERGQETYQLPTPEGSGAGATTLDFTMDRTGEKVVTFKDIRGDTHPVRNMDLKAKVEELAGKHPNLPREELFVMAQQSLVRA